MKHVLASIASALFAVAAMAYPKADVLVSYKYHHFGITVGGETVKEYNYTYILLANSTASKFYSPQSEYLDSLHSTPSGRALENQLMQIGVQKYITTGDDSAIPRYKGQLYVYKSVQDSTTTVYDTYGLGQVGKYTEPIADIVWEMGDSTKNILGYECQTAMADYHGRRWKVWFTSEIPLKDGPWKLCGLPGLILEAHEDSGQHSFSATGIERTDKEMIPVYMPERYDNIGRKEMLKEYRAYLLNGKIITGIIINSTPDGTTTGADPAKGEVHHEVDFLETDYRE